MDNPSYILQQNRWQSRVGNALGLWVCVVEQRLHLVRFGAPFRAIVCSTAQAGTGQRRDSYQTPLGWHEVRHKAGDGLPVGAVLAGGHWTGKVWQPGDRTEEDLILTRILRLSGLEPGHNQGGDVDSWARGIFIHGTNDERLLGQPASHGCIRVSNTDAIGLYDMVDVGCRVLITP